MRATYTQSESEGNGFNRSRCGRSQAIHAVLPPFPKAVITTTGQRQHYLPLDLLAGNSQENFSQTARKVPSKLCSFFLRELVWFEICHHKDKPCSPVEVQPVSGLRGKKEIVC